MRLNDSNIGAEILKIESNRITAEMNTKAVVIAYNCRSDLSTKLYTVLKRDFSVIMTECSNENKQFPHLDIADERYFGSFLTVHNIRAVILTSEWAYHIYRERSAAQCRQQADALINICGENGIKIIYVSVSDIFLNDGQGAHFSGSDSVYTELNNEIRDSIYESGNNLVIETSTFYGSNEYVDSVDFPNLVLNNLNSKNEHEYDDSHYLEPVLSDEIGFFLSANFEKSGKLSVHSSPVTAFQWAKRIESAKAADTAGNDEPSISESELFSNVSKGAFIEKKQKNCIFHLVYKLSPMDYFGDKRIAETRIRLGNVLADSFPKEQAAQADCVIPVPKTGLYYAMGLAQGLKLPYIQALSKDTGDLRSFQVNSADVRKSIIKNKVIPIPELIKGKKVIVVDEAIFTGTTLKVVCKMLRDCGAEKIFLAIPTPQCYNQCPYYVQPKRAMLLEYVRENMLNEYFGVDSVSYQDKAAFKRIASEFGNICMECFFGGNDDE